MKKSASFILTIILFDFGCGKSSSEKTTEDPSVVVLNDKPSFGSTDEACKAESSTGCIQGFISHGMGLTLAPKPGREISTVESKTAVFARTQFIDAQDFGDRFDTAFLKPLLGAQKAKNYDIKIAPMVKRDNFANQFELYAEDNLKASDRIVMASEGNFIVDGIEAFDQVGFRAVKTFRIEISRRDDADADAPDVSTPIICLEIDAMVDQLIVKGGSVTAIGGLRNFEYYYTESDAICDVAKIPVAAQSREIPAEPLTNTEPSLP